MSNHTVSVSKNGDLYYASCSCGWKAKGRFTETMARREAEEHLLEPTAPPSLLEAHRNGQMEWPGTRSVSEDGGLLSSTMDRIRNGQGPRFQFGEIIGLARRGRQSGAPTSEPGKEGVAHQAEKAFTPYQCFMLGAHLGDTIENLQQQTEDLVEQAAVLEYGAPITSTDSLRNLASDLRDCITVARGYCGLADDIADGLARQLSYDIYNPITKLTAEKVISIRRQLDELTARMANLENKA